MIKIPLRNVFHLNIKRLKCILIFEENGLYFVVHKIACYTDVDVYIAYETFKFKTVFILPYVNPHYDFIVFQ